MHISYSLHSLYRNLADGEYVLIPEQGACWGEGEDATLRSMPSP
jgi:hypothetical protein